ncbi:hypothetical protein NKJ40_01040 [Mesorhizobium sp. M0119]|uniref:hypothetical protein n=1 Tax=unclassified Mesorhizobium TaxID=325217 RepID=UPI0033393D44
MATIKVDPVVGGMSGALDTLGVKLGLAPVLLGGADIGGAAVIIGLHDGDSVSQ